MARLCSRATVIPPSSFGESELRGYAWCGRDNKTTVTILVNLGETAMNTTVAIGAIEARSCVRCSVAIGAEPGAASDHPGAASKRKVWVLTAGDERGLHSRRIRVNGQLIPNDGPPPTDTQLAGAEVAGASVMLAGHSAAFVVDAVETCGGV